MHRHDARTVPVAGFAGLLAFLALVAMALADTPDQAGQGARIYAERCSTCHGDVGQGLTAEWRATWAEGDRNCWIPACHGGNPPKPFGFTLPRTVPAVAGPGALTRFSNAAQLHAFIASTMPLQEPGVLSNDEYWALTAYLLRINGAPPAGAPAGGAPLDATTAPAILVPKSGQPVPKPQRLPSTAPRTSMQARDQSIGARALVPDSPQAAPATPQAATTAAADTATQAQRVPASSVEPLAAPSAGPAAQGAPPGDQTQIGWPLPVILLALAIVGVAAEANRRKGTGSS